MVKKISLSAMFFCVRINLTFFYRSDTSNWKYVIADAYSRFFNVGLFVVGNMVV